MASLAVASATPRDAAARFVLAAAAFGYPALLTTLFRVPGWVLGAALTLAVLQLWPLLARHRELFGPADRAAAFSLMGFLAYGALESFLRGAPNWLWINYARLLGVSLVFLAIRAWQPSSAWFYRGCSVGAIAAAIVAVWQVAVLKLARAEGLAPPFGEPLTTIFGGLAVILAFTPIAAGRPRNRADALLASVGLAAGLLVAMLSGARGAWVAAAVLSLWCFGRRSLKVAAAVGAAFVVASVALDVVAARWSAGFTDLVLYGSGNAATSLGTRFDLWRSALAATALHPLWGLGPTEFHDILVVRAREGLLSPFALQYDHAHSELLHALATGGLVKAAITVAAFAVPYLRLRAIAARRDSPAARAGQAVILGFVVVGIADTFLIHRVALTFFVVAVAWLLAWAEQPADRW